jgi:hypothetical protein
MKRIYSTENNIMSPLRNSLLWQLLCPFSAAGRRWTPTCNRSQVAATSVAVELVCACLYPYPSFPSVGLEVILWEGWKNCFGASSDQTRLRWLQIFGMPSIRIGSQMTSSDLGLLKQEISLCILTGLASAGQEEHCSCTLTHNDWYWIVIYLYLRRITLTVKLIRK